MKPVNGLTSWHETHFEVVDEIVRRLNFDKKQETPISKHYEKVGRGGMYDLAKDITDRFEEKYKDFEWDGNFFDEIEKFCAEELDVNLEKEL
ncbi:MAG: hypothetical protein ACOC2U_04005 [bacterium]